MPQTRTTARGYARGHELRREATPEERILWEHLRRDQLGVKFRRQHALGPYIVDFCCIKRKLIIEIDGGQHVGQKNYDEERTAYLESEGFQVLRFWNGEVMNNINSVIERVRQSIG